MGFVRWYNESLKLRPKTTQIISAFILTYSSDSICQYIEKPKEKSYFEWFDYRRALNLSFFGAGVITPMFHYWYKFLARNFPGRNFSAILLKTLVDRLTIGPFTVTSFFVSQHYLNGGNTPDLTLKLERDLPGALKMNISVWMSAVMINFKFIQHQFQILFLNTIGFFWMIYLTKTMNSSNQNSNNLSDS